MTNYNFDYNAYPVAQVCPCCAGTGRVSRPPGVAGDQMTWTDSNTGPYICQACGGGGVLYVYHKDYGA